MRNNNYLSGNKFAVGAGPNRTSFKAGSVPWNKGLIGWCPHGSKAGQFKKGQIPVNLAPIGTIRIREDKNGALRRFIKVATHGPPQHRWKTYAVYLWECANGHLPSGSVIHHKDGDSLNDQIANYEALTRSEHIQRHREHLRRAMIERRCQVQIGLPIA